MLGIAIEYSLIEREFQTSTCRTSDEGYRPHTLSTKLSTTRFSPALSNLIVSLLPSTAVTLPLPNFWWKTRSPTEKEEVVPVDLATSSPSMVRGSDGLSLPLP